MNPSILAAFSDGLLVADEIVGRRVLEVGSCDVNGSVRPIIEAHNPASYLGVDNAAGPRVDRIVACADLIATFGESAFDIVISTEMLEHVRDWQTCIINLATVLSEGGLLVVTTRSPGFPYHPYPEDHWRFPVPAMWDILAAVGLDVIDCRPDPGEPGVIAKAHKPAGWKTPINGLLESAQVEAAR